MRKGSLPDRKEAPLLGNQMEDDGELVQARSRKQESQKSCQESLLEKGGRRCPHQQGWPEKPLSALLVPKAGLSHQSGFHSLFLFFAFPPSFLSFFSSIWVLILLRQDLTLQDKMAWNSWYSSCFGSGITGTMYPDSDYLLSENFPTEEPSKHFCAHWCFVNSHMLFIVISRKVWPDVITKNMNSKNIPEKAE